VIFGSLPNKAHPEGLRLFVLRGVHEGLFVLGGFVFSLDVYVPLGVQSELNELVDECSEETQEAKNGEERDHNNGSSGEWWVGLYVRQIISIALCGLKKDVRVVLTCLAQ